MLFSFTWLQTVPHSSISLVQPCFTIVMMIMMLRMTLHLFHHGRVQLVPPLNQSVVLTLRHLELAKFQKPKSKLDNKYDELFSGLFSAFHRWTGQLTFSKTTWWRWIASLEVELWIIRSHSGYYEKKFLRFLPLSICHHVIVWSKFSGDSGSPPTRPSSVQLCWAPHLKVNSPIFFSLNVNSSIGVSKGIGPSTSATYHGRIWSWTVVNRTVSPLKTSFNTRLTWRQQRPRVTITTQWNRQFINYLIKTSKSLYGCPCNDVRAIRKESRLKKY